MGELTTKAMRQPVGGKLSSPARTATRPIGQIVATLVSSLPGLAESARSLMSLVACRLVSGPQVLIVTARSFSDILNAAMIAEKPLRLALKNGRQHRVLLPVAIRDSEVAFAGSSVVRERIVVPWREIASLEIERQGSAAHERAVSADNPLMLLLKMAGGRSPDSS
jgi:hypothetical protein